jgi:rubredoxin
MVELHALTLARGEALAAYHRNDRRYALSVKYMCESCGFIYDPADGDPDGGIPPGTAFEDIPETWFCPVCGARKQDFTPYEG